MDSLSCDFFNSQLVQLTEDQELYEHCNFFNTQLIQLIEDQELYDEHCDLVNNQLVQLTEDQELYELCEKVEQELKTCTQTGGGGGARKRLATTTLTEEPLQKKFKTPETSSTNYAVASTSTASIPNENLDQIKELETKLSSEQENLSRLRAAKQPVEVEDYMQVAPANTMAHKAEISKARMSISKLQSELAARRRLADIARPAAPPVLTKSGPTLKSTNSVVYGKRIRLKEDKKPPKPKPQIQQETEFVEEMDSDEETIDKKPATDKTADIDKTPNVKDHTTDNKDLITNNKEITDKVEVKEEVKVNRVFGPMRPPENYVVPESYFNQESDRDLPEITDE